MRDQEFAVPLVATDLGVARTLLGVSKSRFGATKSKVSLKQSVPGVAGTMFRFAEFTLALARSKLI